MPFLRLSRDQFFALGIFIIVSTVYILLFSGVPLSTDEVSLFTGAQSLSQRGVLSATPLYWNRFGTVIFAAPGHAFPNFEPGQMALAAPLHRIARYFPNVGLLHAVWMFNCFITGATAALLFLVGRRLAYSVGTGAALAGMFALGSIALPYARTFFREPLSGLGLLLAFYGLLGMGGRRSLRNSLLAGIGLGLAYATKRANLVVAPVFLVGVLLYVRDLPRWRTRWLALAGLALATASVAGLFQATSLLQDAGAAPADAARNVSEMTGGGLSEQGMLQPLRIIRDYLFSPGKSIFLYTPFALAGLLAWPWFLRRHPRPAWMALGFTLTMLGGYGYTKGLFWFGGLNWGPRFLVPVTPFLLMPALILFEQARGPHNKALAWALAILGAASVGVQALAVAVPMSTYSSYMSSVAPNAMWTLGLYDWRYTPFVIYWRLINRQGVDFVWARYWSNGGTVDGWPLLLGGLLLGSGGWGLVQIWRGRRRLWSFRLSLLLLPLLAFVTLRVSVDDPRLPGGPDRLALSRAIDTGSRPNDALLLDDATLTNYYLNTLHGAAPLHAIAKPAKTLTAADEQLFVALQQDFSRVWLISAEPLDTLPQPWSAARPHEAWWNAHAAKLAEVVTSPYARASLYVYPEQPLSPEPLGVPLGDRIVLESAGRWQTLEWFYLELHWVADQRPAQDDTVFVQLLGSDGKLAWQHDARPQQGFRPTTDWQAGERVVDRFAIPLDRLAAGNYRLIAGMYFFPKDGEPPQRLPVKGGGDFVALGALQVP
ncbi:MAG: hypothetical protein CVU38_13745 [Chloroflexi bacterium HGW-Chloroflexi-1]|nr:MAG: hypothetical protein CVU38_13745 [Chloroflexi bacterium HGW-Chloroflexi-1]